MKYFIVALVFSMGGFFAGYLLTRQLPAATIIKGNTSQQHAQSSRTPADNSPVPNLIDPQQKSLTDSSRLSDIAGYPTVFDQLFYAHRLADAASIETLKRYLLSAIASNDAMYNYNIVSIFLEKFTALDPTSAIKFIETHTQFDRQIYIPHIVTSWVRSDPEAAIDYYRNITNLALKQQLGFRLLQDPTVIAAGFESEIASILGPNSDQWLQQARANQLAPQDAYESALAMTGSMRTQLLQSAVSRWAAADPAAVLTAINGLTNIAEKSTLLSYAIEIYANSDAASALTYVRQYQPQNINLEIQVLNLMATQNPAQSMSLIEEFVSRTGNSSPLRTALSNWIRTDSSGALTYLDSQPIDEQQRMKQFLAYEFINAKPEAGFDWLMQQASSNRNLVSRTLSGIVNQNTLEAAERTLSQLSDPEFRGRLFIGIARFKAANDPEAAMAWLTGYRREPEYDAAYQQILSRWSEQDPRAAADAIEGVLDKGYAPAIASQIASYWYRADPEESVQWVNSLPVGNSKYSALSSLVTSVAGQDTESALTLLKSIPEGNYLDRAKRNVAWGWVNQAPGDVDRIISTLGLDANTAAQLRQLADQRPR